MFYTVEMLTPYGNWRIATYKNVKLAIDRANKSSTLWHRPFRVIDDMNGTICHNTHDLDNSWQKLGF